MEEILIFFLQGLVELLMQVFGSGFLDLFTWWWDDDQNTIPVRGFVAGLLLFLAGRALGGLSLWLLPHRFLPWGWLRMVNLLIEPLNHR